jgi:hypothetical protein
MALDDTTKQHLIRMAARQKLEGEIQVARGSLQALGRAGQVLASLTQDLQREMATKSRDLQTLGTAASLADEYGEYSSVDQLLRLERFAGKAASVDHIQAHPACNEAEAIAAWRVAALEATGRSALLQDPAELGGIYRQNLLAAGKIPSATWEAQRAWIVATPRAEILG